MKYPAATKSVIPKNSKESLNEIYDEMCSRGINGNRATK